MLPTCVTAWSPSSDVSKQIRTIPVILADLKLQKSTYIDWLQARAAEFIRQNGFTWKVFGRKMAALVRKLATE